MRPIFIFSVAIFVASVVLCQQIISDSGAHQQHKQDSAEINSIKYGLFSIHQWKEQLATILSEEINKLNLTNANELQLKGHVELQLNGLIDKVDNKIRESNKGTAKGWLKQSFINAFVDIKDIKAGIPEYADAIIVEMTKAQTQRHLKSIVKKRMEKYFDRTFEVQDFSHLTQILQRVGTEDRDGARIKLRQEMESTQKILNQETCLLIVLSLLLFALLGLRPGHKPEALPGSSYILLLLQLVVLLLAGITLPMIDMEAKISEMTLVLLDHPITFVDQVLYFQTKSVLDVFWIMMTNEEIQMKFVGILMVTFSVVFPLVKMLLSVVYYYNFRGARARRWVHYFLLKSGKWSMTDVLVVAIFMAYIGFNGIISSQFGHLKTTDPDLVVLTTNGTSLQLGFYLFLTYTLLALFFSGLLLKKEALT